MIDAISVSVVIVSRNRPLSLARCLLAVSQLLYSNFEVIVVTDKAGATRLWSMPEAAYVKLVQFDEPNISAARNLGIAQAAGEIVAFIDDDAVPEPSWLTHLIAPFSAPNVTASGGFVRGRNGISWQRRAQSVDLAGRTYELFVDPAKVTLLSPTPEKAIKTEGTNMAVRRSWLAEQGGFDPGFHYFLDETDVNMRLAADGSITAVAPLAQVHHGYEANPTRSVNRVPLDLYQIGASWTIFLDKHCPLNLRDRALARIRRREKARALNHMVTGAFEPRGVKQLMQTLEAGLEEGHARGHRLMPAIDDAPEPFLTFPAEMEAPSIAYAGRSWRLERLREKAQKERQAGRIVTVVALSPTTLRHKVRYTSDGLWQQTGGLFGKSDRRDPMLRFFKFRNRVSRELENVRTVRLLD